MKDNHPRYQSLIKQTNAVNNFFARLSDREKEIAIMLFWKDLKIREISEELHLDETWIRKLKARLLRKALKAIIPIWA